MWSVLRERLTIRHNRTSAANRNPANLWFFGRCSGCGEHLSFGLG